MRGLKVLALLGLILAVSGTAGALTFNQPYTGPITIKFTSWDMGVVYNVPGALVDGIGALNAYEAVPGNAFVYAAAAGGLYYDTNGVASNAAGYNAALREDGWGILRVKEIYASGIGTTLWLPGDGGKELTMMFYGLVDNALVAMPGGGELIQSQNLRFDLYENAVGTFTAAGGATQGSGGRNGFASYNGISNGAPILSALTTPGIGLIGTGPGEFRANFTPNAPLTSGSGTFAAYLNVTGGSQGFMFDTNMMPLGSDITVNGTTTPNDGLTGTPIIANWTVLDEDPFRTNIIPEPITMLGVFLGIGGLGGYIRRRRMA